MIETLRPTGFDEACCLHNGESDARDRAAHPTSELVKDEVNNSRSSPPRKPNRVFWLRRLDPQPFAAGGTKFIAQALGATKSATATAGQPLSVRVFEAQAASVDWS